MFEELVIPKMTKITFILTFKITWKMYFNVLTTKKKAISFIPERNNHEIEV